jgi:hypothetical protein
MADLMCNLPSKFIVASLILQLMQQWLYRTEGLSFYWKNTVPASYTLHLELH